MWTISKDNPEGLAFFIITAVFAVIALFFICLRVYSQRLSKARFDASDYCCFLGLVSFAQNQLYSGICADIFKILCILLIVIIYGGGLFDLLA